MFTCLCGQVTVFMDDGILSSVIPELSEHDFSCSNIYVGLRDKSANILARWK